MKLSVVIVNYNVRHFLEQCLHSVFKAIGNIPAEVFVVDNNSVDGSCNMAREKFPQVILIENKKNYGFSYANNQAIKQATGEYILLLNPDTVVEETTFEKVSAFMDNTPDAGGLGVKMIDGKGNFLPESKRGLPTPWVAFYKIFGLSRLFPKSKKFGRYHLSFLDENKTHQVDVLAGAFMLLRKTALDKTGLLDEDFFMYGEDIDLSYRITKSGYRNYYFPETTIIHYKGESTKKGSVNYVKVFYSAMAIFARKHFSKGNARFFSFFISLAIWFRALLAVASRFSAALFLPVFDALLIFSGFLFLIPYWENLNYNPGYYPPVFLNAVVPAYIVFWLSGIFFSGGYRKPVRLVPIFRGLIWGTIAILLAYSLIDEKYRFSRALILLSSGWAVFILSAARVILSILKPGRFRLGLAKTKRIAIIGHKNEAQRVDALLKQSVSGAEVAGFVAIDGSDSGKDYIGNIGQIEEIIRVNKVDELIFCAENLSSGEIIKAMLDLSKLNVDYKIAPPESLSIIGSNSIHTAGDLYVVNVNAISKTRNKRQKRAFDFSAGLAALVLSPVVLWFYRDKSGFLKNIIGTISGKISWVGFIPGAHTHDGLPVLKPGILNPGDLYKGFQLNQAKKIQVNLIYAKDYNLLTDLEIILKNLRTLSRKIA